MQRISLGIPFFNTSSYLLETIKHAATDTLVTEIVINDDHSSDQEWNTLNRLIDSLSLDKIKLFRNHKNIGAFRNKFLTVLNCTSDWVYLLDSDNHSFPESHAIIRTLPENDPLIIYAPERLVRGDGHDSTSSLEYQFGFDVIGPTEAVTLLRERRQWFDWFINTGNYIVHRKQYIEALKDVYADKHAVLLEADTAATFYFALKHGMRFQIVPDFSHYHRLRSNSNWHTCGQDSIRSVQYYSQKILEL